MHIPVRKVTGALLMIAGGTVLVGTTAFASAQSTSPAPPPVPSVKAVAGHAPPAKPYAPTQQQLADISTAVKDQGIATLLAGQKSHITGSKAVSTWTHGNGSTIGTVVELTLSSPITIPVGHPAVAYSSADTASAKGYRTIDSPLRMEQVEGLRVYVDGRTGAVAGYLPMALPGVKTVVVAPQGYTGP